ncbi:RNA polymerase sigma-70 factor (ECF subfamily) [Thermoflavifilum aggregans]|uniref:RNA polymerase sigma-70 factor (ECF subfamily) n=1 Tax=Thermoflavifilum aggregans TaxID=454188 RepID=A0A2M9CSC0_9BACT|nr:RNA polymerase sigma factor [Thermoflavifilum aggregans]MBX6380172.1 RNA polymerase sigma factor [Thermoflavifilum aggregans]PJJ74735.1 RNA polymerase sigma-70 factor (ECF subfamily) [Thermoflavifilum aggregans]
MTEKEYNDCVDLYADGLYRFVVKNLRQEETARDLVQVSFERLWQHRKDVAFAKAKSYLFTVAYHAMIDHLRVTRLRHHVPLHPESFVQQPRTEWEVKHIVEKALNELDQTQKMLIMLKDYEGYRYEEIAQITGLSLAQVKVYLHRARKILKQVLEKYFVF